MRFTNHFILDFENNLTTPYWSRLFPNSSYTPPTCHSKLKLFTYNGGNLLKTQSPLLRNNVSFMPNLLNLNFLRKERLYTKLKYSRSPAYDIVSGGTAAILAGFLGFLVSEKFGFELVDSGDFYYLLMYVVLLAFSVRPLLVSINNNNGLAAIFSLRYTFYFFIFLITQFLRPLRQ